MYLEHLKTSKTSKYIVALSNWSNLFVTPDFTTKKKRRLHSGQGQLCHRHPLSYFMLPPPTCPLVRWESETRDIASIFVAAVAKRSRGRARDSQGI